METLYEHVSKDLLPDVYGGAGGSAEKYKRELLFIFITDSDKTSKSVISFDFE